MARVWVHEDQFYRVFNHRASPHAGGFSEPPVVARNHFRPGFGRF
jgi:hypothetical protein